MSRSFFEKLKLVKLKDVYTLIFIFPIAYLVSKLYKNKNKNLILICEDENEARDNGYWLYKYIKETYPDERVLYAINSNSPDSNKIRKYGEFIEYSSFKHWIYYLSAGVNVSTQKGGKPNSAVCYLLEVYGIIKNKRVFLQHGITISDAKWLYYSETKMDGFVCGAEPEYREIKSKYGYPEGNVKYLGFPRFDNLHDIIVNKKQILVMPTWREWLSLNTAARKEFSEGSNFIDSEYFSKWNEFLSSEELISCLEENNITLVFYPHRHTQPYIELFERKSEKIIFADWKNYDIQKLLIESALLITDYSSVFMDFSYMRKPSLYYQFDYQKFREGQYAEGYFDYQDGFGEVYSNLDELISAIKGSVNRNFKLEEKYKDKINDFFPLYDKENSERNYRFIKEILEK